MNSLTNEIFRILNFMLVMGIFAYLIRRFGILQIVMMMRQEKAEKKKMKDQLKLLFDECTNIDQEIKEQEKSYRIMKDKFQIWQQQVQYDDQKMQKFFEQRQNEFKKRQMYVLQSLQQRRILQQQLPSVLQEITQDLQIEFAKNDKQKKAYIEKVLSVIEEKHI